MTIEDLKNTLLEKEYIAEVGKEYVFTNKFYKDMRNDVLLFDKASEEKVSFKQFIKDAEVPRYLPLSNGGRYSANTASKSGEYGYRIAVKAIGLEILVEITKRYYKSNISNKRTITNYFKQRIWETQYEEYKENKDYKTKAIGERELEQGIN